MSSTNKTTNYQLSQFVGTDIPSILNDYNGDMRKIDTAIKEVSNAGGDNASDIAELQSTVGRHSTEIGGLNSTVNSLSGRMIGVEGQIATVQQDIIALDDKIYKKKLIATATGTFDEKCAIIENAINELDVNGKIGCVLAFNVNGQRNIMPVIYATSANYSFAYNETTYFSSTNSVMTSRRQVNLGSNGYTYNGLTVTYNLQTGEISNIAHTDKTWATLGTATFELYA